MDANRKILAIRSASQFAEYLNVDCISKDKINRMLGVDQAWVVLIAHRRFCFIQQGDAIGFYLLGSNDSIQTRKTIPLPCSPRFIWKHVDAMLPAYPSKKRPSFLQE